MRGYVVGLVLASLLTCGCDRKASSGKAPSASASGAKPSLPSPSASVPLAGFGWEGPSKDPSAALRVRTYSMQVRGDFVLVGSEAGVSTMKYGGDTPEVVSTVVMAGSVNGLSLVGKDRNLVAVSTGPDGLVLLAIAEDGTLVRSNPAKWTREERKGCDSIWQVREGADGELFAACGAAGVALLDLADRTHPKVVDRVATGGYVRDISVVEDDAGKHVKNAVVAAAGRVGIAVVDMAARKVIGRLSTPGESRGIEVRRAKAYVADGAAGLRIIELGNRSEPKLVGTFDPKTMDMARSVTVSGNTAYLCLGDSGLMFLDVSKVEEIRQTHLIDPERAVNRVSVIDNKLYAANDADGVMIVDVSDAKKPRTIYPKKADGKN